jgi:hypothetical protein
MEWKLTTYVERSLGYYEGSASRYFWAYHLANSYVIGMASAIPVLLKVGDVNLVVVSALAASVAGVQGIASLFRLHENWLNYRSTAELIRREVTLYEAGVDDYANRTRAESLLVKRVEGLVLKEHAGWLSAAEEEPAVPRTANAE